MLSKQHIQYEIERLPEDEAILSKLLRYIKGLTKDQPEEWLPTLDMGGRYDDVNIRETAYPDADRH